ncbi:MAG TPA: acyltransferase [Pseudonocardiaceae bacterium]|jgi:peptidoglycan/LPS O-acetylase OafA/YrhL|nr:acyltransferase [Pseudonocardiaceae bacterium]
MVSTDTFSGESTVLTTGTRSAPNQPPCRLDTLTGMRFFAALAVVLCHVGGQFTGAQSLTVLASYGYIGVSFFFMLSGFVLTWSSKRGNGRRFLWMRFCRVWPLQFLLTMVAFTVLAAQEVLPGPFGHVAEILLLQAWSPQQGVYFGGNGVSWSLSCEMFFYLLFPFVAPLLDRLRGKGLLCTAAATVAVLVAAPLAADALHASAETSYWLFFIFPPYRFGEFLLGMVLAKAVQHGLRLPRVGPAALGAVAALGVVLLSLTAFTLHTGSTVDRPFVALLALPPFALLLLAGTTSDLAGRSVWLNRRLPVRLGEWSFALYLVHKPLFLVTASWGWWGQAGGLTGLVGFVGFLALALSLAALLHHATEKPIERYLRRWPVGMGHRVEA